MRHAKTPAGTDELTEQRLVLIEQQLTELSSRYVRLAAESRAQAAIIRRRNLTVALLGLLLRRLLLSYSALARVRDTSRPARVLDTGTPGVGVIRR